MLTGEKFWDVLDRSVNDDELNNLKLGVHEYLVTNIT